MLIEPYVGEGGEGGERERVAYDMVLALDDGPPLIGLVPRDAGDALTCFRGVRIFGLRLKAGTTPEEARALMAELVRLQVQFEAIYAPPGPHWDPSFPSAGDAKVVLLRRAA